MTRAVTHGCTARAHCLPVTEAHRGSLEVLAAVSSFPTSQPIGCAWELTWALMVFHIAIASSIREALAGRSKPRLLRGWALVSGLSKAVPGGVGRRCQSPAC